MDNMGQVGMGQAGPSVDMTPEEAKAEEQNRQEALDRARACGADIQKILDRYNCDFDVTVILRHNTVMPQIQIIAKRPGEEKPSTPMPAVKSTVTE